MENCKKCGATINNDDLFCKECGEAINNELKPDEKYQNLNYNKQEENKAIRIVLIIATAILFWTIGWFFGKVILG